MVWSDNLPFPLTLPPGAGPNDDRLIIDYTGIRIYKGSFLVGSWLRSNPYGITVSEYNSVDQNNPARIYIRPTGSNNITPEIEFYYNNISGALLYLDSTGQLVSNSKTILLHSSEGTGGDFLMGGSNPTIYPAFIAGVPGVGVGTPETWHNLPLNAALAVPWTAFGGGYETPQYRMGPDGWVQFKGVLNMGTKADGTTFATLPAGYRPPAIQSLGATDTNMGTCMNITVQTTGAMQVNRPMLATIVSIDGLRMRCQV